MNFFLFQPNSMLAIWFIARSLLPYNPVKNSLYKILMESTCQTCQWEWAIALYSVMDIVYIFLILLIPSFLHKCKHAKTVHHNYSYAKRQNNQSTWVLGISHMGLRYNVLEFN